MPYVDTYQSPLGQLLLLSSGDAITAVQFDAMGPRAEGRNDWKRDPAPFVPLKQQLTAYFAGDIHAFDVPLDPPGTEFQRRVWRALTTIPYGQTKSYGWVAEHIGSPRAVRAVGAANGRNPISILIPCHRVIGANGSLTGYGGGLQRKQRLLDLERS